MSYKKAIAATAAVLAIGISWSASAETKLRFHTWASPKHHINSTIMPAWKAAVEKASSGRIEVEITHPPKMPPPRVFDRVASGVSDVGWSLHDYTPGRFKLAEIAELPFWGASATNIALAHWRTHNKFFLKADEHRGVKLLGFMTTTGGVFQTKFPLSALSDLNGRKFRVPGGIAKIVAQRLGIVPVGAPAPKVYNMLQQGVVDGVLMPPETAKTFRLMEVTTHMTLVPEGLYYSGFYLVMNQATFDKLSKEDQAAIEKASGENFVRAAGKVWDSADGPAMAQAKKIGVTVQTASAEMRAAIKGKLGGINEAWAEAAAKKGVDGKAALAFFAAQLKALSNE
jgi:TRAP-type C4-dicarboxylate transport system substrate-binding protein